MSTQDRAIPPTAHNQTRQEHHLDKQQNGGHADTRAHAPTKDIQLTVPRNPTHTHYVRWLLTIESPSGSKWPSKLQPLSGSKWHVWVDNKTTIHDIKDAMCRTTAQISPNNIDIAIVMVRPGAPLTVGFKLMTDSTEARDFDLTPQNTMIMLFKKQGSNRGNNPETTANTDQIIPETNLSETTSRVEYEIEEDTQQATLQKLETQRRHKKKENKHGNKTRNNENAKRNKKNRNDQKRKTRKRRRSL